MAPPNTMAEALLHPADTGEGRVSLAAEREEDQAAVSALIERAFGPGRYAKASERLREGNIQDRRLSVCAFWGGELIGAVRQWPVLVGDVRGVFLGPIAVEADARRHGVAGLLIGEAARLAAAAGERFILLVGHPPLFSPHGFAPARQGQVLLPGPADPARILWKPLFEGALDGVEGLARVPEGTGR